MATARRVDAVRIEKDNRDVQLTLSIDEAEWLKTLLHTKIAGSPDSSRRHSDAISQALSSAEVAVGVKYSLKFTGSVYCNK